VKRSGFFFRHRQDGIPEQARAAFQAGIGEGTYDLTGVADLYVRWAQDRGSPAERAEAFWMRSVVTEREAMRRELPASRLRVLAKSQHIAAEAGYWLGVAQREWDAVVVAEQSRGITMTRMIGSLEPATRAQLLAAGRDDLLGSYLDALRHRADVLRGQYAGAISPAVPVVRDGRQYLAGTASAMEAAQAAVVRLTRQVNAVTQGMDALGVPSRAVIQEAAGSAPLVYLASADRSGYALIVRRTGRPVFLPLPGLASGALATHTRAFSAPSPLPGAVDKCVFELARVLAELAERLPNEQEIGLIPLGSLSLLPVHAALLLSTEARPSGPLAVRILLNARLAAPARSWSGLSAASNALIIDVTRAPGGAPLRQAREEAGVLAAQYGFRQWSDPTRQQALRSLADAEMVQFLCHGRANLAEPLTSGLLLADGWLTVQMLLSRPPARRQLVILAACESLAGQLTAPDELMGLPAALYQAGALGVVAARWEVEEQPAYLLLRRFHQELAGGSSPVRALTTAQNWLRTATAAQMSRRYPGLFPAARRARRPELAAERAADVPYHQPVHWAAFGYTGG
jgi:hypothetical protein